MIEGGDDGEEEEEEEELMMREGVLDPTAFAPPVGSFCGGKQRGRGRRESREGRGGGGGRVVIEGGLEGSLGIGGRQCGQWR